MANFDYSGADTDVLLYARINSHARSGSLFGIPRHQLHVHEWRLAWLVEVLVRHHRVVPVQYLALLWRGHGGLRHFCVGIGMSLRPPVAAADADGQQPQSRGDESCPDHDAIHGRVSVMGNR